METAAEGLLKIDSTCASKRCYSRIPNEPHAVEDLCRLQGGWCARRHRPGRQAIGRVEQLVVVAFQLGPRRDRAVGFQRALA